jgi:LPXTG-motif cell wall-anchored protein
VVGTYTVTVVVNTDKGSVGVVAVCTKQVTVEAAPVVSSVVTSEKLPDTGAGAVAGIFAGVSALAGAGHYVFRRYIA